MVSRRFQKVAKAIAGPRRSEIFRKIATAGDLRNYERIHRRPEESPATANG